MSPFPQYPILTSVTFSPPFPCHVPMTESTKTLVSELGHETKPGLKCFSLFIYHYPLL